MSNPQPSSGSGSSQSSNQPQTGHWPARSAGVVPVGSHKYVNDSFGEPTGAQDRVVLEGSAVVSRTDVNGNLFEALTDGPHEDDVPIKVREAAFEEEAAKRYEWNSRPGSGSGSSSGSGSGSGS